MESKKICVLTFNTTNYALDFEKKAKQEGIFAKLIPVPRSLSASCGTAAEIEYSFKNIAREFCDKNDIEFDEIHEIEIEKKRSLIKRFLKTNSKRDNIVHE